MFEMKLTYVILDLSTDQFHFGVDLRKNVIKHRFNQTELTRLSGLPAGQLILIPVKQTLTWKNAYKTLQDNLRLNNIGVAA